MDKFYKARNSNYVLYAWVFVCVCGKKNCKNEFCIVPLMSQHFNWFAPSQTLGISDFAEQSTFSQSPKKPIQLN